MSERRQLSLPEELCAQAEQRYGKRFARLEELLEFMLIEMLREDGQQLDGQEQRIVEERLRELGYI